MINRQRKSTGSHSSWMNYFLLGLFLMVLANACNQNLKASDIGEFSPADSLNIAHRIDSLMQGYDYYNRFSGTVLVAYKDQVMYAKSFGYANAEKGELNHINSVYGIGSLSKQFTAAAILKLLEDKKISLDDNLAGFFPGLGDATNKVTIHHLLSMSSGINQDFSRSKTYDISQIIFPEETPIGIQELVYYFDELSLDFNPGNKYDYSNMNYILLAAIIERVSGKSYQDYLHETFWLPLQMHSTCFGAFNTDSSQLANPYLGLPNQHDLPPIWHDSWTIGAGGVFSSAPDLHHWLLALKNEKVLRKDLNAKLFENHTKDGKDYYGYGWEITTRNGHTYITHPGGTLGYVSESGFYPEHDLYVIVLSNHTHDLWELGRSVRNIAGLSDQIHNILFQKPLKLLPTPTTEPAMLESGMYSIGGFHYLIQQQEERVSIHAQPASPSILDLYYHQEFHEDTRRFKKAEKLALAFGKGDFRKVRRKSVLVMRVMLSNKKLTEIWNEITGDRGAFVGYNFYRIPGGAIKNSYTVRLVYENKEVGLRLNMKKSGRLRGIHIDQQFSFAGPQAVEATAIDGNLIFLDGFRYNYPDYRMEKVEGQWKFITPSGVFPLLITLKNQ
jgi:CubicO group peptidase (beta-lactamase class C family)